MNTYCTFYIVRHGQSEGNVKQVISGQKETNLSELGRKQAQERAKDLFNVHFDAVFSSDLARTVETARIILLERKIAINTTKALRERSYGKDIQGKSYDQLREKIKRLLEKYYTLSYKERLSKKIVPDYESDEELIGRFVTFLRETALAYPGKNVLIVSHGNIMRTFLVHLGFGTHQELAHSTIKNTGYFVLKSDGVDFEVVKTVGIEKKRG
ncbi:MAG TPA: histidine phosphatase family protein [Patescibacteria group bacterium]|nr:histidine phosphatase family protein [Patescibacteria group bacterium]